MSPDTADDVLPRALDLGEAEVLIVDPETAVRARAATIVKVLVLGGVGEQGELPPAWCARRASIPPA